MDITLNIVSGNKHVLEIKRYIRTLKERVWVILNTLSFKKYPKWCTMLRSGLTVSHTQMAYMRQSALGPH